MENQWLRDILDEMRTDIRDMKKDIRDLDRFKFKWVGIACAGGAVTSLVVSLAMIYFGVH